MEEEKIDYELDFMIFLKGLIEVISKSTGRSIEEVLNSTTYTWNSDKKGVEQ